ncbi:MAG: hypothetical protein HS105_09440 [Chloracidobacterium sp.]|nr:hypothetical protein [Chloracidobacterium sp.]MCO5333263.1 hypothetical protein [Pyrinomonadaceae bacterium]
MSELESLFEALRHYFEHSSWRHGDENHLKHEWIDITERMLRIDVEDILKNSCFCYSAGADITPIVAFKDFIHSYVYCDICEYTNYFEQIGKLKKRLDNQGFCEIQKTNINASWLCIRNQEHDSYRPTWKNWNIVGSTIHANELFGEFSIWKNKQAFYCLLYVCWDSFATWMNLYQKFRITPKAVCDLYWEGGLSTSDSAASISPELLTPEYWIPGWGRLTEDARYEEIGEVSYFGDFGHNVKFGTDGPDFKEKLFKRRHLVSV